VDIDLQEAENVLTLHPAGFDVAVTGPLDERPVPDRDGAGRRSRLA
jgi:hypothetical protein